MNKSNSFFINSLYIVIVITIGMYILFVFPGLRTCSGRRVKNSNGYDIYGMRLPRQMMSPSTNLVARAKGFKLEVNLNMPARL